MMIQQLDIHNRQQLTEYLSIINAAFQARAQADSRIPFVALREEKLYKQLNKPGRFAYIAAEEERILGGICCNYVEESHLKIAKVFHVCTAPEHQGKGISRALMERIHNQAMADGRQMMQLNVSHLATPAIELYKSLGYQPLRIYENTPGTFHFIRYIKSLSPFRFPEYKRKLQLAVSKLKFLILFRKDSTPTWLYKVIYR